MSIPLTLLARTVDAIAFIGLLAAAVYAPLAYGSLTLESELGLMFAVGGLICLVGLRLLLPGDNLRLPKPLKILAIIATGYLALVFLSALNAPNPTPAFRAAFRISVHVAGFFLAAALLRNAARRNAFVIVLLLTALVAGAIGFAEFTGHRLFPGAGQRISSTYYNPIHYSGFLDLVAPIALAAALLAPRIWQRILAGVIALVAFANALLTFSYASWGALALVTLAILIIYAVRPRFSARRLAVSASVLLIAAALGVTALAISPRLSGSLQDRVATVLQIFAVDEATPSSPGPLGSLGARMQIWEPTVTMTLERPLLGAGPGNFIYEITRFRPETAEESRLMHRFVNYAHHDYLQVASEIGLPALVLFVAFWLLALTLRPEAPRPRWFTVGASMGIIALLIHGFMDGNLTVNHSVAFLAFTLVGASFAASPTPTAAAAPPPTE